MSVKEQRSAAVGSLMSQEAIVGFTSTTKNDVYNMKTTYFTAE